MSAAAKHKKSRKPADRARAAVKAAEKPAGQTRNGDQYLTWPYGPSTVATIATECRFDRAHTEKDRKGLLLPAPLATGSSPRRYPACYMQRKGRRVVSFESVLDELHERQQFLAANGVDGFAQPSVGEVQRQAAGYYAARHGEEALRLLARRIQ